MSLDMIELCTETKINIMYVAASYLSSHPLRTRNRFY